MDENEGEVDQTELESAVEEEEPKKQSSKTSTRKSSKGSKRKNSTLTAGQQQLFLVEFLVDTVSIDSCSVDEEILQGQTCLSLTFLNFPPMDICEKDFDPNKDQGAEKVRFNCGKSLMFAFNENQCDHPPPLSVEITVFKKLGDEENPIKVEIGVIKICVSELFRQIVEIAKFKPEKLPTSKSIKDCFMLIGPGKRTMGEVSVYIRLSCLGQNVVTEFQCGPDLKNSPVLFKSKEGKKMFEFTGNETPGEGPEEGEGAQRGSKPGCGCIPPPAAPAQRGGQGDVGRGNPPVNASYPGGNKVVLDLLENKRNGGRVMGKGGDCRSSQGKGTDDGTSMSQAKTNPDQNCFVLKVGDKGQIPDRGKMILEFRTPKQKIPPKILPPYHEDIGVQTDSSKKGKGKDKKKK